MKKQDFRRLQHEIQSCAHLFLTGLKVLKDNEQTGRVQEACVWFDSAIGLVWEIKSNSGEKDCTKRPFGEVFNTQRGLRCLPYHVVRLVEYERLSRQLQLDEKDLSFIRNEIKKSSPPNSRAEVRSAFFAMKYLKNAASNSRNGNVSAEEFLEWIIPGNQYVIPWNLRQCVKTYIEAVQTDQFDTAIFLRILVTRPLEETDAMAKSKSSTMTAQMLYKGNKAIKKNLHKAATYYRIALSHDSDNAMAAIKLGMMYANGGESFEENSVLAEIYFEQAIDARYKKYAPHYLEDLLRRRNYTRSFDIKRAVEVLLMQASEGQEGAQKSARKTLSKLLQKSSVIAQCPLDLREKAISVASDRCVNFGSWKAGWSGMLHD